MQTLKDKVFSSQQMLLILSSTGIRMSSEKQKVTPGETERQHRNHGRRSFLKGRNWPAVLADLSGSPSRRSYYIGRTAGVSIGEINRKNDIRAKEHVQIFRLSEGEGRMHRISFATEKNARVGYVPDAYSQAHIGRSGAMP